MAAQVHCQILGLNPGQAMESTGLEYGREEEIFGEAVKSVEIR